MEKWYKNSFRRNLVDMHIEDWDKVFLSKFDTEKYADLLVRANVQTAMIYAQSHVGYCYWNTKSGYTHNAFRNEDLLGKLISNIHNKGMSVSLYYSLIFNNWAYKTNPKWRTVDVHGNNSMDLGGEVFESRRYGICCPNNLEYRQFVDRQMSEICSLYDFENIFFDMTFWPTVCYCDECKKRFMNETNFEIPEKIDWDDNVWNLFQEKRIQWISEFAKFATDTIKSRKSNVTVTHNNAMMVISWSRAHTDLIMDACEFASGDFYGGYLEQSFLCKLYWSISKNKPIEFMTSRCYPTLFDHTTTKEEHMLALHHYIALAHHAAFLFIDAIELDGTIHEQIYDTMGKIFEDAICYEKYVGGQLIQDAAIFYNLNTKYNESDNGQYSNCLSYEQPHLKACLGAAKILQENHIPYGVIANSNINNLNQYKMILLANVIELKQTEIQAFEKYVEQGGNLYISGNTSKDLLNRLIGAEVVGKTDEEITYVKINSNGAFLWSGVLDRYSLTVWSSQYIINGIESENILANIELPFTDPKDTSKFASIHTNPNGRITKYPSIISKEYGKGKVAYSAASLEMSSEKLLHKTIFKNIILNSLGKPTVSTNAPEVVEITSFKQGRKVIINIINIQEGTHKPIVVNDINITVSLDGKSVNEVKILPENMLIDFIQIDNRLSFKIEKLYIFKMVIIEYFEL